MRPVLLSERLSAVSPHCLASLPTGEIAWYGFYVPGQCALAYRAIMCIVKGCIGGLGYVTQTNRNKF